MYLNMASWKCGGGGAMDAGELIAAAATGLILGW